MSFNFFLLKKLIKSSKRNSFFSLINWITFSSIGIGVAVLILALQILNGFQKNIEKLSHSFDSDIKIVGFSNKPLIIDEKINNIILDEMKNGISEYEFLISQYAVAKSDEFTDGALVVGLPHKTTWKSISRFLIVGKMPASSNEIVLGCELANKLQLSIGNTLTIFALSNENSAFTEILPNIEQFKVSGIIKSGMYFYDSELALTSVDVAKNLFSFPENHFSGINIYLNDYSKTAKISKNLKNKLPYPFWIRNIEEIHRNIFVWLELQKVPIPIVLTAILLVSSFNIIGSLLIIILRKRNAIGILLSLGMKKSDINKVFILQGIFITFISTILGILIAITLTFLQNQFEIINLPSEIYFIEQVTIDSDFTIYLIVAFSTLLLGTLISLIPSRITKRFSPTQILKSF